MSHLHKDLLNILRCPVTGSRLRLDQQELSQQELVSEAAGPDGHALHYPVQDGIAILLPQPTDHDHPGLASANRESSPRA